jgi:predicted ferric reductase
MRIPPPITAATIFLALLPLLLAAPQLLGGGTSDLLHQLGRATGIAGTTCFLLAAVLSARIPGIDPWLGGLTAVWRLHHLLGAASFLLLMAHPLLLGLSAAAHSPWAPASVLWPPLDHFAVWAGWLALVAMMVFLAPSFWFFGRPPYQPWKRLHLLSGVALVLGVGHALALNRAMPGAAGVAIWGGLGLLAVLVFAYRAILSAWIGPYRYRVTGVETLARGVVELSLAPESTPMRHRPGQFAYLRHFDPEVRPGYNEEHPYTLSSSPDEEQVRIGIKALGDASSAIAQLHAGASVTLDGPYGRFFPPGLDDTPQLWIGGGIGITPFVSAARDLGTRKPRCDVALVYCANRPERAYYGPELEDIAGAVDGFSAHLHYFNERGVLDLEYLRGVCPDFDRREIFICGPPAMTDHVVRLARESGVPRNRIHTEAFDLL